MKGLYIHIPFCKSICSYCDFPKIIAKNYIHEIYVDTLIKEIDYYFSNNKLNNIDTVYIGGGTPNSINLSLLNKILAKLKPILINSIENSIELNPELVTDELCVLLNEYNINRISLGVESVVEKNIKILNRHHNRQMVVDSYNLLKKYGFDNINLDFMFGIPNENMLDVDCDLSFISEINPKHISFYSLILEDKTILKYKVDKKEIALLDDDLVADMYDLIKNRLNELGYHHYEISNFAYPGYESKHNLLYWNCDEYIGLGASSCGYIDHIRYQNNTIVAKYLKKWLDDYEKLSVYDEKEEYFMLGLRKIDGVSISKYIQKFKSDPFKEFKIAELIDKGLLELNGDILKIKYDKIFVGNLVFEEFVGE